MTAEEYLKTRLPKNTTWISRLHIPDIPIIRVVELMESYHQSKMREELKKLAKDLQHKHDVFIGSLKDRETMANSEGFRSGLSWAIDSIEYLKTKKG